MTALRKDGTPVVPVCLECRFHRETISEYCESPRRKQDFDPVYGYSYQATRCRDARMNNDLCGIAGNWYEPIPVPVKPTFWQKVKKWLNS